MNNYSEGDIVMISSKIKYASKKMILGTIVHITPTGAMVLDKEGYIHKVELYEICPSQNLDVDST